MILVSCCNEHGGIFGINETTLQAQRITDQEARGLAVENGFVYVATHNGIHLYKAVQPMDWQLIISHRAEQNWHGVAIRDGVVYSAVSKNETIMLFDKLLNPINPIKYDLPRGYPNDLCFFEGELYYCLPRAGHIMKWPSLDPIIKGLAMPHSLVITADHIYTCNSAQGTVIRYSSGDIENILQVREYTRGLCMDGSYMWMGLSRHRRTDKSQFRCGVIRKDLKAGTEDFVPLPADEVYDIKKM